MDSMLKAMIALALVLPMTAYVAGSLMASGAGEPADRGEALAADREAAPHLDQTPCHQPVHADSFGAAG